MRFILAASLSIAALSLVNQPPAKARVAVEQEDARSGESAQEESSPASQDGPRQGALERLLATLAAEGVHLDLEQGHVSIGASVLMRDQLLEYVLVGPGGATHEALFYTEITPSLLNAAILALGTDPGRNAAWVRKEAPEPAAEDSRDERQEGDEAQGQPGDGRGERPEYRIVPPHGDGLYLHATWREGDEIYFFRVEDLIANLDTGRAMERHRLVFLGSRMAHLPGLEPRVPGEAPREVFVADHERNLVNLIYFSAGNTLLTCVHGETNRQDVWAANIWNLPEMEQPVMLVFSKTPLTSCPDSLRERLPEVVRAEPR